MTKTLLKFAMLGLTSLFVFSSLKASQPDIPPLPNLEIDTNLTAAKDEQAQLQGVITNLCYWVASVAEHVGTPPCKPDECNTPAGFYNCLEKVSAWLEPELCNYLKSELHSVCNIACTRITCIKGDILKACKTVCCPLNSVDIQSCMGKKQSCEFPPIVCGGALEKKGM